jgi:HPt (histidine-containing phosphotransfer) domain-containing protein
VLHSNDAKKMEDAVHKAKGSTATVGLMRLSTIFKKMMYCVLPENPNPDFEKYRKLFDLAL